MLATPFDYAKINPDIESLVELKQLQLTIDGIKLCQVKNQGLEHITLDTKTEPLSVNEIPLMRYLVKREFEEFLNRAPVSYFVPRAGLIEVRDIIDQFCSNYLDTQIGIIIRANKIYILNTQNNVFYYSKQEGEIRYAFHAFTSPYVLEYNELTFFDDVRREVSKHG